MTTTSDEITTLARRLEDGYARIDEAEARGQDTYKWTEYWLKLLRDYELLCDDLAQEPTRAQKELAL